MDAQLAMIYHRLDIHVSPMCQLPVIVVLVQGIVLLGHAFVIWNLIVVRYLKMENVTLEAFVQISLISRLMMALSALPIIIVVNLLAATSLVVIKIVQMIVRVSIIQSQKK
jgi:hypothetical protein